MFRPRAFIASLVALLLVALPSCDMPTGPQSFLPTAISLSARFASIPSQGSQAIRTIRLTARDASSGAVLVSSNNSVDPEATSWTLNLDVPMGTRDRRLVTVAVELISRGDDGVEHVEWSTQSAQVQLIANKATNISNLLLGRGPLSNLGITSVTIGSAPERLEAGTTATLTASAGGIGNAPIFFWTSLDSAIANIDVNGLVSARVAGTARLVVAAGTKADTATIEIFIRPSRVAILAGNSGSGTVGEPVGYPLSARVSDAQDHPVANVPVTFAVAGGGGSIVGPASISTDAQGIATLQGWQLGTAAGPNTLTASVQGLPPITFAATALAGAPRGFVVDSGSGQSAASNAALPTPLVVRVTDQYGNPVSGVVVTFTPSSGTTTNQTATTDSTGRARTTWTLGTTAGAQTLTASASGLTAITFAATALATSPKAMAADSGNTQSGTVNVALASPIVVRVSDQFGNAVPGIAVSFTPSSGSVSATSMTTGSDGRARTTWTLGTVAGTQTLIATALSVAPVTYTAKALPGAAKNVVVDSGNGQSGVPNVALSAPLVVRVTDQFGNAIANAPVAFTPSVGTVANPSAVTDSTGRARTAWTPGSMSATQTVTATVNDLTPAIFTATITLSTPSLALALDSVESVGVGKTARLRLRLSTPAPAAGLSVTFASSNANVLTLGTDAASQSVVLAAGDTVTTIAVTGHAEGTASVTASAGGYESATLPVNVDERAISLPATINVPFTGIASLPVTLTRPAPLGGVVVTLQSSAPTVISVPASVTIPAGATTANATLTGLLPGSASITASNAGYSSATTQVVSTATLLFDPQSVSFNQGSEATVRIRLTSNGVAVAAPASGITVTLASQNTGCVSVPATALIAAGQVDTTVRVTYGGSGPSCDNVQVHAAASNITADTLTVAVTEPTISLSGAPNGLGAGLQRLMIGDLGSSNHGPVTVHLQSSDSRTLVAPNATTAGSSSLEITVASGSSFTYYLQRLDGSPSDTTEITASATGFIDGTVRIHTVTGAIAISNLAATATTFSSARPFLVQVGVAATNAATGRDSIVELQARRANAEPISVLVTSSDSTVGQLVFPGGTAATALVGINANQTQTAGSVSGGGVAFSAVGSGQVTISATAPGFTSVPQAAVFVAVSAPPITLTGSTIGAGLMRQVTGSLGASGHPGVTVHLVSKDPQRALVSVNAGIAGTDSIAISIPAGSTEFSYYVHGVEGATGSATIRASASGFSNGNASMAVVAPAIDLTGLTSPLTTLSPDQPFVVRVGIPSSDNSHVDVQPVRIGGTALTVTISSNAPAIGLLIAGETAAAEATVQIPVGQSQSAGGSVAFRPVARGSASISATAPGVALTSGATFNVAVNASTIGIGAATVGASLQKQVTGSLSSTNHGAFTLHLVSSNPSSVILSPNASTAGSASIDIPIPSGASTWSYYVQGTDNTPGTSSITASAPGFADTTVTMTVVMPAMDLSGLGSTQTTLSPDAPFVVRIGIPSAGDAGLAEPQELRAGHAPLTVTVRSNPPSVGRLVTSSGSDSTITITLPAGASTTATAVSGGGVALDPLTSGSITISATIEGFTPTTNSQQTVAVVAPGISLSSATVGAGLVRTVTGSLGAPAPTGGVTVHLTSSQASTLLLSSSDTSTAASSVDIAVAAGSTSFTYYVSGVERSTGAGLVTATATGYSEGTATMTVVRPAVELVGLSSSTTTIAADQPFYARIGIPSAAGVSEAQPVRVGAQPLVVTLSSSSPSVGTIRDSSRSSGSLTFEIPPRASQTAVGLATGGAAFDALTAGSTIVSASIPDFTTSVAGSVTVNVVAPNFSFNITTATVGAGLQDSVIVTADAHPSPISVHLASADGSKLLLAPNATTAGSSALDITLAANQRTFTFYVQALDGTTGAAAISVSATEFTTANLPAAVVTPSVVISSYQQTVIAANNDVAMTVAIGVADAGATTLSREQKIRVGGTARTVTVTSNNTNVGKIRNSSGALGGGVTTTIGVGQSHTVFGSVAFAPVAPGTTTIGATISGFTSIGSATGAQVTVVSP